MASDLVGPYRTPSAGAQASLAGTTIAFLRGTWGIERVLTDHRSGARGSFTGEAEFLATSDPAELRYAERGELRFGEHRGPARRTLLYRELPGGAADVRFADGRAFYRLDLRSGQWTARHDCGQDRYLVSHLVRGAGWLEERWQVSGPGKAYDSVTTLRRLDAPALDVWSLA
ncbi:MAG TPA: DUF6314 family protein [Streptosporangiaceae bacterium]|nr:DUF6314 family protein [Streptosporangiaceae bacterium]